MLHCPQESERRLFGDILVKVLSFVERQQRIGSCSLVCRAWRSAAAAATPDISIILPKQDTFTPLDLRCSSFETWLVHHGSQVHSLQLGCTDIITSWPLGMSMGRSSALRVHMPCQQLAQLQRLCVDNAQLQPSLTAGAPAAAGDYSSSSVAVGRVTRSCTNRILSGLSSLTMLQLTECSLGGRAQELAALSALTQLQHLQLKFLRHDDRGVKVDAGDVIKQLRCASSAADSYTREISDQLCAALPHMTALTYLCVKQYNLTSAVLRGLGRLQQLRELRLKHIKKDGQTNRALNQMIVRLPASITSLRVPVHSFGTGAAPDLDSRSIGALQQLSKLQHLALPGLQLQDVTGFMEAVSQITSLSLGW
jgi:hypothetical protein